MRHKRRWRIGGRPKYGGRPISRGKQKQRLKEQARAWGFWKEADSRDAGSGLPAAGAGRNSRSLAG